MGENFGIPILDIVYLEAERRPAACDVGNLIKRSPWLHPKQGVISSNSDLHALGQGRVSSRSMAPQ